ncbi:molybdopterin-guanine dinucleotide biosynthesis protein B [Cereibacter sphaeroides f. sp. denitrificans]
MRVYGIIGWKDAGKTGLVERLVAAIAARGFSVSTVKHSHHDVDPDPPGSDSHRHRAAGAAEVVLAGPRRLILTREHRGEAPRLAAILERMAPVDLVLVEGYKTEPHPKIEVFRKAAGQPLRQPEDPWVRAVASDTQMALPVPVLDLDETEALADFLLADSGLVRSGFDTVIAVDWSGASVPSPRKPSSDAIWIGVASPLGETVSYHRTRADAEAHLNDLFAFELTAGRRVLAGFDFPFGYPEGFAPRLTGPRSGTGSRRGSRTGRTMPTTASSSPTGSTRAFRGRGRSGAVRAGSRSTICPTASSATTRLWASPSADGSSRRCRRPIRSGSSIPRGRSARRRCSGCR